jgi:Leucine-rich repeat (LRR) protein
MTLLSLSRYMNTADSLKPDIVYDVSRTILSRLSLSDALLARRISSVWKTDVDHLIQEAWQAVRKGAGSPTSSPLLAGMIAHVTEAAFNVCSLEHLEQCPLGQEVSACELFGRLDQLFRKTYGIRLDFTRSLGSLTEQIQELQIKQQQIHDRDLCAIWPKIHAALPSTATSAPPPAASANEIRAWMMDPANASHLASITTLNLCQLQLRTIPPEIGWCSQLSKIDLSSNQITSIPEVIGQLSQLSELLLSNNQITSISDVIGQLSKLSNLVLSNNQITSIPDVIGQLSTLSSLALSNNQIKSIPDAIGQLSKLLSLALFNNQITSIPDAIGQLSKLLYLHLSNNYITSIPSAIGQLSRLSYLYLNNNQITSIPDAIGQLSKLSTLSLSVNQITSIPDAIGQLPKLLYLSIHDNPILCIAKAVLTSARTKDNATFTTFAEALQWDAKSPLAKLCLAIMQDDGQAMQNMPALLSHLSPEERERIFFHVWNLNKPSKTPDVRWSEQHVLDNPELFMRAVHRSIVGHLARLSQEQREAVYRKLGQWVCEGSTDAWWLRGNHATENLPRLADALAELKIINDGD